MRKGHSLRWVLVCGSFTASRIPFICRVSRSSCTLDSTSPHHARSRTRKVRFAAGRRAESPVIRVVHRVVIYDRGPAMNELSSSIMLICCVTWKRVTFPRLNFHVRNIDLLGSIIDTTVYSIETQFRLWGLTSTLLWRFRIICNVTGKREYQFINFIISKYWGQSINNPLKRAIVYENWWLSLRKRDSELARSRFITFKQCSARGIINLQTACESGSLRHTSQRGNILLPFHMYPRVDVSFRVMQRKCDAVCIVISVSYLDWRSSEYGITKITTSPRTETVVRGLTFNFIFYRIFIRSYRLVFNNVLHVRGTFWRRQRYFPLKADTILLLPTFNRTLCFSVLEALALSILTIVCRVRCVSKWKLFAINQKKKLRLIIFLKVHWAMNLSTLARDISRTLF